jgi:hypothetical protein
MLKSFDDVMSTGYSGAEITASAQQQFTAEYEKASGRRQKASSDARSFIG